MTSWIVAFGSEKLVPKYLQLCMWRALTHQYHPCKWKRLPRSRKYWSGSYRVCRACSAGPGSNVGKRRWLEHADNLCFPVAAMKYRCVACCIVNIRLIRDHSGIRKLRQRPKLASEPANCMDPAPRDMQLSLSIVVLWYDRLT